MAPEVETIVLQPGQMILGLSNFGDPGAPGGGYGGGDIIDFPEF